MKQRICIDLRVCQKKSRYTGVGVYALNLCKTLLESQEEFELFFLVLKGYDLPFEIDSDNLIYVRRFRKPESYQELLDFLDVKYLLKKNYIKVFHSLVPSLIRPTKKLKVIVTIHDIIPDIIKEEQFKSRIQKFIYKMKMYSASKSNYLIFDSDATKIDFLNNYTFNSLDYKTIYLGSQFGDSDSIIQVNNFENVINYIFYIGGFNERKNVKLLINTFLSISKKYPTLKLIIAGKPNASQKLDLIRSCGNDIFFRNDIIWKGFVKDIEIPSLFIKAKLFVYPSSYEGFGLPVLEAMKFGTPTITTKFGSIPEIAGEAVSYLKSNTIVELSRSITQVLEDENYRNKMISNGKKQSLKFSWQDYRKQLLNIYSQLLPNENRN